MVKDTINNFDDDDIELFGGNDAEYSNIDSTQSVEIGDDFSEFDDAVIDIDFSDLTGSSFKNTLSRARNKIKQRKGVKRTKSFIPRKPLSRQFGVSKNATIVGRKKQLGKVIVPDDRQVIVEGVSKFILSNKKEDNSYRNIGYYKGKKLQELVFVFNNDSALDFNISLFNPSMPLDYLYATSQNINDKVQVAGNSGVSYTDVLFNILANPILIRSATFVISGAQDTAQKNIPLRVQDKYINGVTEIAPVGLSLSLDVMQVFNNSISFHVSDVLNRPLIPDGMDVIDYTILAGNTVTMCFYHEQKAIKKLFFPDARIHKPKRM
jgi:hypothetical protein